MTDYRSDEKMKKNTLLEVLQRKDEKPEADINFGGKVLEYTVSKNKPHDYHSETLKLTKTDDRKKWIAGVKGHRGLIYYKTFKDYTDAKKYFNDSKKQLKKMLEYEWKT